MGSVDIRAPDLSLVPHWDALVQRAGGNVFMHPAALCAAAATGFARIHVLLAWDGDKLVGQWALPVLPTALLGTHPHEIRNEVMEQGLGGEKWSRNWRRTPR